MTVETTDRLTITLPVPSPNTGGNARGHWTVIRKARNDAWEDGRLGTIHAMVEQTRRPITYPWDAISIIIDWYGWNRPDRDNALSRCKPYIDGIVAAGLIPDDSPAHVRSIQVRHVEIDRSDPRVLITVERIDGNGEDSAITGQSA